MKMKDILLLGGLAIGALTLLTKIKAASPSTSPPPGETPLPTLTIPTGETIPIFAPDALEYPTRSNIISGMGYIDPITRQVIPAPSPSQAYAETHYYNPITKTFESLI